MYWDAISVKPIENYRILVELRNGKKGVFNLKPYLDIGIFKELRNLTYFNQVDISLGAVTWSHEQDIAPETLVSGLESVLLPDND